MKIYVTHSSDFDYKNELYRPLRECELNKLHEIILPHEKTEKQFNSQKYIRRCDLVLAEVSYASTGQGIELGWANFRRIPIVCLYKKDAKLSASLKVISSVFIKYANQADMIKKISDHLLILQKKRKTGGEILRGMLKHASSGRKNTPRDLGSNDEYLYGINSPDNR